MIKIRVEASIKYDIVIGNGLLANAGRLCMETLGKHAVAIVSDDTVDALYGAALERSLKDVGYEPIKFVIPHGEASKSMENLGALLGFLADNHITRSDFLIALGGGVVGDLTGFAAAVYLRGIKFVQIPTTLLAAVDSSVGGKTAVNITEGKNLVGSFHQPSLVICDYETLDSLPDDIFADGCAEVIKYGVINDAPLFEKLKKPIKPQIEDIIANCVSNKRDIVNRDERDHGERRLLNLGHTVGHAVEICSEFGISHGSAVAIGMATVARASAKSGICAESVPAEIEKMLAEYSLPTKCKFTADELAAVAAGDKKRMGGTISFILPRAIGDSYVHDMSVEDIRDFIALGL